MILDDVFSSLDAMVSATIFHNMKRHNGEFGTTVLLVTHNIDLVGLSTDEGEDAGSGTGACATGNFITLPAALSPEPSAVSPAAMIKKETSTPNVIQLEHVTLQQNFSAASATSFISSGNIVGADSAIHSVLTLRDGYVNTLRNPAFDPSAAKTLSPMRASMANGNGTGSGTGSTSGMK